MPTYDTTSFDPPAPLAYVTLRHSTAKASCTELATAFTSFSALVTESNADHPQNQNSMLTIQ